MRRKIQSSAMGAVVAIALVACSSSRELGTATSTGETAGPSASVDTSAPDTTAGATDTVDPTTSTSPSLDPTTTTTTAVTDPADTVASTTASSAMPTTTTTAPAYGTPEAPIVVVSGLGVLGWWDGSAWVDSDAMSADIPVPNGVDFTTFTEGPEVGHARSIGIDIGCEPIGSYTVLLDPPTFYDPDPATFAVNSSWNLFPRPVTSLDTSNPEYVEIVRQQLIADGLTAPTVQLDQLLRTDLDGDGTDEVLIAASHPDLDLGLQSRAGWFSIVMIRQIVGTDVRTTVLARDIHTTDGPEEQIPNGAQFGLDAVADFNGDGRSEITVWGSFWEGASETLYDVAAGAEPAIAVDAGCGS